MHSSDQATSPSQRPQAGSAGTFGLGAQLVIGHWVLASLSLRSLWFQSAGHTKKALGGCPQGWRGSTKAGPKAREALRILRQSCLRGRRATPQRGRQAQAYDRYSSASYPYPVRVPSAGQVRTLYGRRRGRQARGAAITTGDTYVHVAPSLRPECQRRSDDARRRPDLRFLAAFPILLPGRGARPFPARGGPRACGKSERSAKLELAAADLYIRDRRISY